MSKLTLLQATAPRRIFLQIDDHEGGHDESFPDDTEGVTWCAEPAQACEVAYVREDLAAAPAGVAEPVGEVRRVHPGGRTRNIGVDVAELFPGAAVRPGDKLYAAPTAQPQPQPDAPTDCLGPAKCERSMCMQTNHCQIETPARLVVLFDDRPQNQRIAEAEERMRNPAPLQFEDESAQPEAPAEPRALAEEALKSMHELTAWARRERPTYYVSHRLTVVIDALNKLATPAPAAPAEPSALPLPHPGLPEVSAALDAVLAEYNYPANPKNAARAGWVAATRWLSNHIAQQPAELTVDQVDEIIRAAGLCVDGRMRALVRAAIKAQGGSQ